MPPDEVVVYTASMPGDGSTTPAARTRSAATRLMLLPTPAVAREVEVLRRHGCDRVLFGAAPRWACWPGAAPRGGRHVALTHGHEVWWARVPVTRQLLRRIGPSRRDDLRQRLVPRPDRSGALTAGRGPDARLSPAVDPQRFHPGWAAGQAAQAGSGGRPAGGGVRPAWFAARARTPWSGPGQRCSAPSPVPACSSSATVPTAAASNGWWTAPGWGSGDVHPVVSRGRMPAYIDARPTSSRCPAGPGWGLEVEAWGIVFLEAQACGLPVVVGDSGGAGGGALDGGRVVDPDVPGGGAAVIDLRRQEMPRPREGSA